MIKIERLLILKDVPLFRLTSSEILLEIAYILKEQYVLAGEMIFTKGEEGDIMYVVAQGSINIHDGEQIIKTVKARDSFGEYAALSPGPRIASATALESSLLLIIERETLYRMMGRQIGLVQGIIEVLCWRLRADAFKAEEKRWHDKTGVIE